MLQWTFEKHVCLILKTEKNFRILRDERLTIEIGFHVESSLFSFLSI